MTGHTPSWITIDPQALVQNLQFFRNRMGNKSRLFPVIKSNAYGHGMNLVAKLLEKQADGFCVHSLQEALKLNTEKPILILGHLGNNVEVLARVLQHPGIMLTISSLDQLEAVTAAAKAAENRPRLYVKLETGTNRLGLMPEDAHAVIHRIKTEPALQFAGVSTHFANIEDTTDHAFARSQLDRLLAFRDQLGSTDSVELHAACSAAALLFNDTHLDLVRLGISLYGYFSSRETLVSYRQSTGKTANGLTPVLSWFTRPIQIKAVPAGAYIGYGLTYRTPRDSRIAVLPVGYADGYDRAIAPAGHVLVNGQRAPIRGRICMNMFMVDVTDIPDVTRESRITLLGRDGDEQITAETLADWAGTIHYELLARISPEIPRGILETGS